MWDKSKPALRQPKKILSHFLQYKIVDSINYLLIEIIITV